MAIRATIARMVTTATTAATALCNSRNNYGVHDSYNRCVGLHSRDGHNSCNGCDNRNSANDYTISTTAVTATTTTTATREIG